VVKVANSRLVREGDRVSIYTTRQHCGRCRHCQAGNWVLCEDASPGPARYPGTHSQYVLLRDDFCLPLPDDLGFEAGSLLSDALGTPFRALKRLGVSGRDTIMVLGAGPVGLAATLLCRFSGATVIAADVNDYRLGCACECGANFALNPGAGDTA
jgi:threonine dehydrogenase-like Zn-dependent dehydrogenase